VHTLSHQSRNDSLSIPIDGKEVVDILLQCDDHPNTIMSIATGAYLNKLATKPGSSKYKKIETSGDPSKED
jgi:hypothetical protein